MTKAISPASTAMPLRVDIVSDVVCPWCIIGYKQFTKAVAAMPGCFELDIHWHPFELNPAMPDEGQNVKEHIEQKYGKPASDGGGRSRIKTLGDTLGFAFNGDDNSRVVNTFKAHQLLHWAQHYNRQTALKLALFKAYFTHQRDVNDNAVLVAIAAGVGLPEQEANEVLSDQRYADTVRKEQQRWRDKEIYSVPMFYFNELYAIPGAQEADTFVRYLEKIRQKELGNQN